MGRYNIRYLNEDEYQNWDNFVDVCKTGSIFNKSFYLKSLAQIFNINFDIIGVYDKDNHLIAGFSFCHNVKLSFKYMYVPSLTPFYSFIILERSTKSLSKKERYEKEITNTLIEKICNEYALVDFRFHPAFKDIRTLTWNSFKTKIQYTYIAGLSDLEMLYANFDSDIKRRIKKTQELNYSFKKDNSNKSIDVFYSLQEKSFVKQQIEFKLSRKQFNSFIDNLKSKNSVEIYTIYFEDKPVSSCVVLIDGKNSYYLLSGTDDAYSKYGFNQLLIWLAMRDLKESGIEYWDLVGANTESIAQYKSNFNFNLIPSYQAVKYNNSLFKLLFKFKKML